MTRKKKSTPKITYLQILCLAIKQLKSEIEEYSEKVLKLPADHPMAGIYSEVIVVAKEQLNILKQLYFFEMGIGYKDISKGEDERAIEEA